MCSSDLCSMNIFCDRRVDFHSALSPVFTLILSYPLQEIHCFLRLPCKSGVFDFINGLAYWHIAEKQRKNRPANVEQLLLSCLAPGFSVFRRQVKHWVFICGLKIFNPMVFDISTIFLHFGEKTLFYAWGSCFHFHAQTVGSREFFGSQSLINSDKIRLST